PQYVGAGSPSGQLALAFDGVGDVLERTSANTLFGLPAGNADRTVIAVIRYIAMQGVDAGVVYGQGAFNRTFGLTADGPTGRLAVQGWGTTNDITSTVPGVGAGWLVQTAELEGDVLTHFVDGQSIGGWTHVYQTTNTAGASRLVIGQEIAKYGYSQLEVSAVLIYDRALSDAERTQVEDYLHAKYLVAPSNQSPIAVNDAMAVALGGSTQIDVLANDSDPDGALDPTSVVIASGPSHGSLAVDPVTGVVTYTNNGSNLPDSFSYRVSDDQGALSNVAVVSISSSNQFPIAANDAASLALGGTALLDILANDGDPDGALDPTSVVVVTAPAHGTATVDPVTGSITYVNDGSGLPDSFTYRVSDDQGAPSNLATVTLTATNQAPIANNDSAVVDLGASVLINILANDSDPENALDPTSVVLVTLPTHGTATVNPTTGQVTYVSDGSQLPDSFSYRVDDVQGVSSNVATVAVALPSGPLPLTGFVDEFAVDSGLNQPISFDFLPDGRMLLLQKEGQILIVDPYTGAREVYMTLFNIDSGGEKGLLDIVVDPNFDPASPGADYFYLYYTPAVPQRARIARFTHQENGGGLTSRANVASELELWRDTDVYLSCCHYGGGLDIGPDGKLWLSTSDKFTAPNPGEGGTNENLPQNLNSGGGKVIRVNTDGSVPNGSDGWPANPFIDPVDDDPNLPGNQNYHDYIWAWGLRNPFRASWDIESGRFFMGEVGGNVQVISHEDLHVATLDSPGVNYGWPYFEGANEVQVLDPFGEFAPPHGFDPLDTTAPIFSIPHAGQGASITGGEVYRGTQFPAEWNGVYFYGDYTRDTLAYLRFDAEGSVIGSYPFKPTTEIPGNADQVVSIGMGVDGALYYVLISGRVKRIAHVDGNQGATVTNVNAIPQFGPAPLSVEFKAKLSDPDGDSLTYVWHFGDGTTETGVVDGTTTTQIISTHEYAADGSYQAYLETFDGAIRVWSEVFHLQVGNINQPPVVAQFDGLPNSGAAPMLVDFTALVTDPENDALQYGMIFGDGTTTALAPVPADGIINVSHTYTSNGSYTARLEVHDGVNVTTSSPIPIAVGTTQLPPVVSGLVTLLESDIKLSVSEGTTIAAWLDQSGHGNNLTAYGDPQLLPAGAPSGLPAIAFDGEGDKLERLGAETINDLPLGYQDRSMFVVVNYIDMQGLDTGVAYGATAYNRTFGLTGDGVTGNLAVQGWGNSADRTTSELAVGQGWMIQSAVVDDNVLYQYRDGTLIDTWSHVYQTEIGGAGSKFILGGEITGFGYSQMEVAAVLIYNRALTAAEHQQVEQYLYYKYFIGNLPPVALNDTAVVANGDNVTINVLVN
ncbi:MAG: PQQ-dependent sugar dehydrogenase, partial [Planctomycetales bacterium]|nr:PQQ-dependent sugar dehydrogenase [Planctomycetales bacterium]